MVAICVGATTNSRCFNAQYGQKVFREMAGAGLLHNDHYAGHFLASTKLLVGVDGGIVAMRR